MEINLVVEMSMEFWIEESIKITRMLDKNSQNITIIIDSILDEKMVNMGVILGTERNSQKCKIIRVRWDIIS